MQNITVTLTIDGETSGDAKSIALDMLDMGYDHVSAKEGSGIVYALQVADIDGAGEHTHTFHVSFMLHCQSQSAAEDIVEDLLQHGYENARAGDGGDLNASACWQYRSLLSH